MDEKDRVEALIKPAEVSWRAYSERRSIEWKVNFGLWAALGSFRRNYSTARRGTTRYSLWPVNYRGD
jgi:hypothetical protein